MLPYFAPVHKRHEVPNRRAMKIITDPKKIERYKKIGMYTSLGSLVALFAGAGMTMSSLFRSFENPENIDPTLTNYSFIAMAIGLVLSQIGVYFANRWGRSPTIDERLTQSLKGLDDRYTLYHYVTPVPHLLAGPSGLWVIHAQYQPGTIVYENKRYRQRGVGLFSRLIGREGISSPDQEAKVYAADLEKQLRKELPDAELPPIQPIVVFTNPKTTVQAADAPVPTIHVEKLKDFVRRKTKETPASIAALQAVKEALPGENVS